MKYPYQGRNFFQEPENYFFADCTSSEFFKAWESSRCEKMLENISVSDESSKILCDDDGSEKYTKTGLDFENLFNLDDVIRLAEELEPFVIKYEVNKRLYGEYDIKKRPVDKSVLATIPDYIAFGECLARVSLENNSLKHLSTLLKLCDALCTVKIHYSIAPRLNKLLESEARLVKGA